MMLQGCRRRGAGGQILTDHLPLSQPEGWADLAYHITGPGRVNQRMAFLGFEMDFLGFQYQFGFEQEF